MLASIVTDDQLFTSQIVKSILLVIITGGIIFNILRFFRKVEFKERIVNLGLFTILLLLFIFVFKFFLVEAALLRHPLYVMGTTMGYCNVFAEGEGIEFEYEVNGTKFVGCSTFHPIARNKIIVPGGKYKVRTTPLHPEQGRMEFNSISENE